VDYLKNKGITDEDVKPQATPSVLPAAKTVVTGIKPTPKAPVAVNQTKPTTPVAGKVASKSVKSVKKSKTT
jgi:hypothetical protein